MATNDGKIYITISDRRFGSNKVEADEQQKQDKEKEKSNPLADFAKHQFFSLIKQQSMQAVNYTISNIGNFTGDYITQEQMQNSMQIISSMMNLATSAYAGFKMTGSVAGAAIAVGAQVIGTGINRVEQLYAGYVANARQNRAIAQLRARAGLNSTNNGSRGTEY